MKLNNKKRLFIIAGLCVFVVALLTAGYFMTASDFTFQPYEMKAEKPLPKMELDEEITLDGYLDEEVWTEVADNELVVTSEVSEDVYLKTRCYLTEKGVYWGAMVSDTSVYYNENRKASRNSSVEIYFNGVGSDDVYSLRLVPTGAEGEIQKESVAYIWKDTLKDWVNWRIVFDGAANVQGEMNSSNCKGWTAEAFVPWEEIGGNTKEYITYMPAFNHVETSSESDSSRMWSGYGGKVSKVSAYMAVNNEGAYPYAQGLDTLVEPDEGIEIDGKLTEGIWSGKTDMKYGYTANSGAKLSLTGKYHATEKGAYFGFVVEDPYLYYADENARPIGLNSGLELYIAQAGATTIDANALELRITATNQTARYRATNAEGDPWVKDYFPLKSATTIQGTMNKENVSGNKGYTVEMFLPWEAIGAEEKPEGVLLYPVIIHSEDIENTGKTSPLWQYCRFYTLKVSEAHNPSENYLKFNDSGVQYRGLKAAPVVFNEQSLSGGYYYKKISFKAALSEVNDVSTCEQKTVVPSLSLPAGITYTKNADQTITLKIPQSAAQSLKNGATYTATVGGASVKGTISYTGMKTFAPDVYVDFSNGIVKNTGSKSSVSAGIFELDQRKNSTKFVAKESATYTLGVDGTRNSAIVTNNYRGPYTVLNNVNFGTGNFAVSTWICVPDGQDVSSGNSTYIMGTTTVDNTKDGFRLTLREEDGVFKLGASTAGNKQTKGNISNFNYGEWHHITAVREKTTMSYYVDGEFIMSETIPAKFSLGAKALSFGGYVGETWGYKDSQLLYDEVRVYYSAVDSGLIQNIMAEGK